MPADQFLVFGLHSVESVLRNQPERIIRLCMQQGRSDMKMEVIAQLAKGLSLPVAQVSRSELDRVSQNVNHQGIIAFCTKPHLYSEADLKSILANLSVPPFVLILDGVQDPHNLGACFRSAEAAGVHAIIAPKDKSVGLTSVVSKVASGAAEKVHFVQVTNLVRALEELKTLGLWIFGAAMEAEQTLYQADLTGPIAIVLGAEGKGLRRLTQEHCDHLIKIPMVGTVESLNVSVAAGIFMFEVVRQRGIYTLVRT